MRFYITWVNDSDNNLGKGYVGYKVSVPNYGGGDVVSIEEVQEIENELILAREQIGKNEQVLKELRDQLDKLKGDDPDPEASL